jgi:hypothetical protein
VIWVTKTAKIALINLKNPPFLLELYTFITNIPQNKGIGDILLSHSLLSGETLV